MKGGDRYFAESEELFDEADIVFDQGAVHNDDVWRRLVWRPGSALVSREARRR